jgi:hypothetical protein
VTGLLDDIDERTPRAKLYAKLRELAAIVSKKDDEKLKRFQKLEEDVRRRYAGKQLNLVQVIATSTDEEWGDAVDFMENFDDVLPVALFRVYDGARSALGRHPDPANAPAVATTASGGEPPAF